MQNKSKIILQIGILLSFIGTVVTNALANILPINGYNTGELSDNIPNLFVPSGLTFSIWGVIYVLLAVFTGYFIRDWFKKPKEDEEFETKLALAFIISNIANLLWILTWHYLYVGLSLILMLIILGSLIYAHEYLYKKKDQNNKIRNFSLFLPISIYLGWITVATVANVTALAVVNNWNGWGISESMWTIIVLIVATLITFGMIWFRKNYAHAMVVVWAFIGILIKRLDPVNSPETGIVVVTIISMILIVSLIVVRILIKEKK
ncbi:hypothetical protein [Candidatus Lokiarchaeum ossiferum]|uniref:hypothetical protein n=1 Tax=Candidatus Lokiarchaeum ossiferum TaxID=2951803 RepID=UPI00352EE25C